MTGWRKNQRGAGWYFGLQALVAFNQKHKLDMVVRAHETIQTGWHAFGNNDLITVFSAPNYQGYHNTGIELRCQVCLCICIALHHGQDSSLLSQANVLQANVCNVH